MTHITDSQKQRIADLRASGTSFWQIAKQLSMPLGSVKSAYYSGRPKVGPSFIGNNGQFKSPVPPKRTGPGRRPSNGLEPATDKARQAAYRQRQRERLQALAGNHHNATDCDLAQLLVLAVRSSNAQAARAIVETLHGRYCVNS